MSEVKQQQPRVRVKGTAQGCRFLGVRELRPSKGRRQQPRSAAGGTGKCLVEQGALQYKLFKVVPIAGLTTSPFQVPSSLPLTYSPWTILTDPEEGSLCSPALSDYSHAASNSPPGCPFHENALFWLCLHMSLSALAPNFT